MKRVFTRVVVAGLFLAGVAGSVVGGGPETVKVRGLIGIEGGVTQNTTIAIAWYRLKRDNFQVPSIDGPADRTTLTFEPGSSAPQSFETTLDVNAEYEMVVVPITPDGDPRKDGRYYFARPNMTGDYPSDTQVLHPGGVNQLDIPLKWVPSKEAHSNILQVVPRKSHRDFLMTLAISDPTNLNVM
jgi:hypothetical protein